MGPQVAHGGEIPGARSWMAVRGARARSSHRSPGACRRCWRGSTFGVGLTAPVAVRSLDPCSEHPPWSPTPRATIRLSAFRQCRHAARKGHRLRDPFWAAPKVCDKPAMARVVSIALVLAALSACIPECGQRERLTRVVIHQVADGVALACANGGRAPDRL